MTEKGKKECMGENREKEEENRLNRRLNVGGKRGIKKGRKSGCM